MGSSWQAYKASWRVVRADPELLLVPLLGVLLFALLMPVVVLAWMAATPLIEGNGWPPLMLLLILLPYAWLLTTVFVLLDALVVVSAHERIQGGSPTLAGSLAKLRPHLGRLLGWAFLMAFVMSLLALVSRQGRLPRALAAAGGVGLSLATMFVVPHLVLEGAPLRGALRDSGRALRERFGAVTRRTVTFGLIGGLAVFGWVFLGPSLLLGPPALLGAPPWVVVAGLVAWVVLLFGFASLHGVVTSVYKAALYDSLQGRDAGWYPKDALLAPFA